MSDAPVRNQPLAYAAPLIVGSTSVRPWQPATMFNVRADASDKACVDALTATLGVTPPRRENMVAQRDPVSVLWLGPDEWLIIAEEALGPLRDAMLALPDEHRAAITPADCSYAGVQITGPDAGRLLARGTPLDCHWRTFGAGHCAQTRLAKADAILWRSSCEPSFRLLVRRSMARYLWRWCEAMAQRMAQASDASEYDMSTEADTPAAADGTLARRSRRR